MTTIPTPSGTPGWAPRKPRVVRPARGTCRVSLEINGVEYAARPIVFEGVHARRLIRLRKADGAVYYVSEHDFGVECDCPDFIFHREGIDPGGCKHIKALAACGMIHNPLAGAAEQPARPRLREARELLHDEIPFGPGFERAPAR
jgi:hypothetical protein